MIFEMTSLASGLLTPISSQIKLSFLRTLVPRYSYFAGIKEDNLEDADAFQQCLTKQQVSCIWQTRSQGIPTNTRRTDCFNLLVCVVGCAL